MEQKSRPGLLCSCNLDPDGIPVNVNALNEKLRCLLAVRDCSAVQEVEQDIGVPVAAIVRLEHLMEFIEGDDHRARHLAAIRRYRETYGV